VDVVSISRDFWQEEWHTVSTSSTLTVVRPGRECEGNERLEKNCVERDLNFSLTLRLSLSTLAELQVFTVSPGVEEIHSAGTINNVETSYFTQLKICYLMTTLQCHVLIVYSSMEHVTWKSLVSCVAELVGSCRRDDTAL